jgi:hypothetical protein
MNIKKKHFIEMSAVTAVLITTVVFNWHPPSLLSDSSYLLYNTGTVLGSGQTHVVEYVQGDKIFDEYGREVIWRGAGGSYLFHAGDSWQEAWQEHLPQIQVMGLNTIRLAFAFPDSGINPEYGTPSADILDYEKLDWVLDFLTQHSMKGILTCMNYLDMYGDFGSQKLANDWVSLARRCNGDSRIVAYELFNEPYYNTWVSSVKSKMDVISAYANLTDAVRAADPEHIVIWESRYHLAYADSDIDKFAEVIKPYLRPNLVFTMHSWLHKESSFNVWNPEQMSFIEVDYLVKARNKLKTPFWLGEFGSYWPFDRSNLEYNWTEQILWRCEEQVLGWNLWMGRTAEDNLWNEYLQLFPLKVYNERLVREP